MSTSILIIEDEGIVAKDIEATLLRMNYTVIGIASNSKDALEICNQSNPDLIFMDIMLLEDNMDGIDIAGKIKQRFDIPIIYLTAYSDEETLKRAEITEPYGYLLKPFQPKELKITIDMAIYKHKFEKKQRELSKWMSVILHNLGDAVIVTDHHGRVTLVNPIAERMIGFKSEELKDKLISSFIKIVEANQSKPLDYWIQTTIQNNQLINLKKTILISNQGDELHVDINLTPMLDESNSQMGVVIICHDISEMKKENDALSEKMRSIEEEKRRLERYFPENLVDFIVDEGNEMELQGKHVEATMMFCDLRNSTGIAEELTPKEFALFLNDLLSGIMDLAYANGGSVNKLLGDGLLITFGCPLQDENDALNCVKLSLQIREFIKAYNSIKPGFLKKPVIVGIGIATGLVFAGNIGSIRHMDYTVLGDAVNTASRLESLTKSIGFDILIDETTYLKAKTEINMEYLGNQEIRGKRKLTPIFYPRGLF